MFVLEHADSRVNKWDDGSTVENFPHLQIGNEDKDVNDSLAYCGSLHASEYLLRFFFM